MSARVKETAKEEVERVRHLTEDAVRSGAYLYPIKVENASSIGKEEGHNVADCIARASSTS